jgi:hypothetical protein
VERSETIPGSELIQVVDTAEIMINVAFNDSIKRRKAARAVRNGYAEHVCPPDVVRRQEENGFIR